MLSDKDRIFTNLYGLHDWGLEGAKLRGAWLDTKSFIDKGRDWIVNEIKASGLRGRGGAGFPTGLKWSFMPKVVGERPHYLVVNADESEPGTCKDREIMRHDPHLLVEGCLIACMGMACNTAYIYVRGEYIREREHLQAAIDQAYEAKLIGKGNVNGWDMDIYIAHGAGAYICGEESALIESLEGKAGIPRNRPPYPVTQGYLGKPTVVNNVETFLAAAGIAVKGGDWFSSIGTEKSKGTKILSISGDCAHPGIYEYPFGITVQTILNDCGAVDVFGIQVGGPSGTFISNQELDRKLAFEDLATGGSFIIFNSSRNILDIVHNFTHFFAHESCGFCTPCRVGTALLKKQIDKIVEGHGSAGDVVALEELCQMVKNYSHCGLGQTAANPILTTLERYPDLYQSRLKEISYEPGFDLDGALETARRMANRDDAGAHLAQTTESEHE